MKQRFEIVPDKDGWLRIWDFHTNKWVINTDKAKPGTSGHAKLKKKCEEINFEWLELRRQRNKKNK